MSHCMNIVHMFIHQLTAIWMVSTLGLLQIMLLLTFMYNSGDQTSICILIVCPGLGLIGTKG